jgi:hypothetical protein
MLEPALQVISEKQVCSLLGGVKPKVSSEDSHEYGDDIVIPLIIGVIRQVQEDGVQDVIQLTLILLLPVSRRLADIDRVH